MFFKGKQDYFHVYLTSIKVLFSHKNGPLTAPFYNKNKKRSSSNTATKGSLQYYAWIGIPKANSAASITISPNDGCG